jgi:hypothetical protein
VQADVIGARCAASFAHQRSTATADSADNTQRSSGASDGASAALLAPYGTVPFAAKHAEVGAADALHHLQLVHSLYLPTTMHALLLSC